MKLLGIKLMLVVGISVLLSCCSASKFSKIECMRIYKAPGGGNIWPQYIILKSPGDSYEIYYPAMSFSNIGFWKVRNDTLFLKPSADCNFIGDSLYIEPLSDTILTVTSIPKKYKIEKNCLIDITNYGIICPEFKSDKNIPYTKYFLWK